MARKASRKAPAGPPEPRPLAPTGKALVVVGEGWAALGLLGFLSTNPDLTGRPLVWISGTGARMFPALPSLEAGEGTTGPEHWARLTQCLGIEAGELRSGSYLREFRNKAFRNPSWEKTHTLEERRGVRDEELWAPERSIAPVHETRFALSIAEIESQVREKLLAKAEAGIIRRIESIPLAAFEAPGGLLESIKLGNGETIQCERFFFADRWGMISQIEGMPKGIPFVRSRDPVGVLQAALTHEVPVAAGATEGFFNTLHKEAGEEADRHLFGYFTSDGARSFWTLCFSPEEAEDNHAIAKKLRRMKNALDKMFPTQPWLPEGKPDFMSNVKGEQVRFEEGVVYAKGEPPRERVTLSGVEGLCFLTDGYGPGSALDQVGITLRAEGLFARAPREPEPRAGLATRSEVGADSEAEGPDASDAEAS